MKEKNITFHLREHMRDGEKKETHVLQTHSIAFTSINQVMSQKVKARKILSTKFAILQSAMLEDLVHARALTLVGMNESLQSTTTHNIVFS